MPAQITAWMIYSDLWNLWNNPTEWVSRGGVVEGLKARESGLSVSSLRTHYPCRVSQSLWRRVTSRLLRFFVCSFYLFIHTFFVFRVGYKSMPPPSLTHPSIFSFTKSPKVWSLFILIFSACYTKHVWEEGTYSASKKNNSRWKKQTKQKQTNNNNNKQTKKHYPNWM